MPRTDTERLTALRALAVRTVADCTLTKKVAWADTPQPLLLPSGDEKYTAFWVRDSAMMAESGLVADADLYRYITLIATCGQNGATARHLAHGLVIPPYAVTDHINYNGKPVFFPGTYDDGEDQGDGIWGTYPPFCDNYYFILMAGQYVAQTGDTAILGKTFAGMTLADRLAKACEGYNLDPETGLCVSDYNHHTVCWGFTDSVRMNGKLLFASLLRLAAIRTMARLFPGKDYDTAAEALRATVLDTFYDEESGWFWSSTGADRQHDVWGTAYAVFLGVADRDRAQRTSATMSAAYRDGRAGANGYIRHILCGEDAVPGVTAWARCGVPGMIYQNGPDWATPLGWYAVAVALTDRPTAVRMLDDFLDHTERNADRGTPFEWMTRDGQLCSGLRYGTSGVLPYIGACRILGGTD